MNANINIPDICSFRAFEVVHHGIEFSSQCAYGTQGFVSGTQVNEFIRADLYLFTVTVPKV